MEISCTSSKNFTSPYCGGFYLVANMIVVSLFSFFFLPFLTPYSGEKKIKYTAWCCQALYFYILYIYEGKRDRWRSFHPCKNKFDQSRSIFFVYSRRDLKSSP